MRLLAATPHYPPHSRVGAWLATHRLLVRAVERGHQVDVLTTMAVGPRAREPYELDGVRVGPARTDLVTAIRLADVVVTHCNDTGRPAAMARHHGRPSVRLYHGGDQTGISDADLVIFNAEAWRQRSDYIGPSLVIHPSVDPDAYRTTTGSRITLVNCTREKGSKTLHRIVERSPGRDFLVVQGGYGVQEGKEIARRWHNVELMPTQTDMRNVYRRTRILLMPSAYETWGMVGVEAMISGIPVIAHPTPGLLESLDAAGTFEDRNDTQAWLAAIERLDDPTEYTLASKRALARADELAQDDGRDRFVDALESLAGR